MSTSVQPRADSACEHLDRDAERRQDDDVFRRQRVDALARIAQEPDARRAQLLVDVRVVDDFAGEETVRLGNRVRA